MNEELYWGLHLAIEDLCRLEDDLELLLARHKDWPSLKEDLMSLELKLRALRAEELDRKETNNVS